MKKISLFVLSLSLFSCQTSPHKYTQEIQNKNCEQALEQIPENETSYKFLRSTQSSAGKVLSYSVTGAAYTAEVLLDVTIGTVGAVILCSPAILSSSGVTQRGAYSGEITPCLPENGLMLWSPPLGRNTRNKTRTWECPSLDGLSQKVREVAQCFSNRGDNDSKMKALKTLESLEKSEKFYECLSVNERNEFTKQKSSLLN